MNQPCLYLITNTFSSYAGETDYLVLSLSEKDLRLITRELAPMATQIQNMGGGNASAIQVDLGHVTLLQEPNGDNSPLFHQFEIATDKGDGNTALNLFQEHSEIFRTGLDGFKQTILPDNRDRMTISFAEVFGDEVFCLDELIPGQLMAFYEASVARNQVSKKPEAQFIQMGEWLVIVG